MSSRVGGSVALIRARADEGATRKPTMADPPSE